MPATDEFFRDLKKTHVVFALSAVGLFVATFWMMGADHVEEWRTYQQTMDKLEEGKLEEFTIERTTDERLVGSIFKGRVRNLEDGLKAAFVDIGFEKNAFLHYWDIVPANFDSGVEVVEREGARKKDKPRITQRDIPRLYPPGC